MIYELFWIVIDLIVEAVKWSVRPLFRTKKQKQEATGRTKEIQNILKKDERQYQSSRRKTVPLKNKANNFMGKFLTFIICMAIIYFIIYNLI